MLLSVAEMVTDFEDTIHRVFQNETALKSIEGDSQFAEEYHALHKAQVSLLTHLEHMGQLIEKERPSTAQAKRVAAVRQKLLQIADLGADAPTSQTRKYHVIKRSAARRRKLKVC